MAARNDIPNQTRGHLAAAVVLSLPVIGWFFSPFVLIILLTRANSLSAKRGRDMLLLVATAAIYAFGVKSMLNLKGDDMATNSMYIMAMQAVVLFVSFSILAKTFKVWAWKGENSPWSS
jgi:uncharacterized membrane protein